MRCNPKPPGDKGTASSDPLRPPSEDVLAEETKPATRRAPNAAMDRQTASLPQLGLPAPPLSLRPQGFGLKPTPPPIRDAFCTSAGSCELCWLHTLVHETARTEAVPALWYMRPLAVPRQGGCGEWAPRLQFRIPALTAGLTPSPKPELCFLKEHPLNAHKKTQLTSFLHLIRLNHIQILE